MHFTVGFYSVTVGLKRGDNGVKISTPFLVGLTTWWQTSPKNNYVALGYPIPQSPSLGAQ